MRRTVVGLGVVSILGGLAGTGWGNTEPEAKPAPVQVRAAFDTALMLVRSPDGLRFGDDGQLFLPHATAPTLVRLPGGALLAVFDYAPNPARKGATVLAAARSEDRGRTWSAAQALRIDVGGADARAPDRSGSEANGEPSGQPLAGWRAGLLVLPDESLRLYYVQPSPRATRRDETRGGSLTVIGAAHSTDGLTYRADPDTRMVLRGPADLYPTVVLQPDGIHIFAATLSDLGTGDKYDEVAQHLRLRSDGGAERLASVQTDGVRLVGSMLAAEAGLRAYGTSAEGVRVLESRADGDWRLGPRVCHRAAWDPAVVKLEDGEYLMVYCAAYDAGSAQAGSPAGGQDGRAALVAAPADARLAQAALLAPGSSAASGTTESSASGVSGASAVEQESGEEADAEFVFADADGAATIEGASAEAGAGSAAGESGPSDLTPDEAAAAAEAAGEVPAGSAAAAGDAGAPGPADNLAAGQGGSADASAGGEVDAAASAAGDAEGAAGGAEDAAVPGEAAGEGEDAAGDEAELVVEANTPASHLPDAARLDCAVDLPFDPALARQGRWGIIPPPDADGFAPRPDFEHRFDYIGWWADNLNGHPADNAYLVYETFMPGLPGDDRPRPEWPEMRDMFNGGTYEGPPTPWDPAEHPDWAAASEAAQDLLQRFREATLHEGYATPLDDFHTNLMFSGEEPMLMQLLLPNLSAHRALTKATMADAWRMDEDGKVSTERMLTAWDTCFRGAGHLNQGSTLIEELVGVAERAMVYENARWALKHEVFSEDEMARVFDVLRASDPGPADPTNAVRGEHAFFMDFVQHAFWPAEPEGEPGWREDRGREIMGAISETVPEGLQHMTRADLDNAFDAMEGYYADLTDVMSRGYPEARRADLERVEETYVHRSPLTEQLLPSLSRVHTLRARAEASRRATQLAYATHLFKAREGRWPASLDELPAEYGQDLRIDPFTGGHFGYQVTEEGPRIYSLSENGTDDGGEHSRCWNDEPTETGSDDYVFWPPQ
ncbi:MAG TPA: sialidase family protein [Phycisphaerae bacterium]|nr:sialidase family protein [Phycisphaerae bacterium]HNU46656.1 sialidase family protein [Phycisphaerae bacterium]